MDCFPTEIILHIIAFLYDVKDKIELSYTNRFMYSLLSTNSNCWSPLDLSLHRGNINNIILLNILRTRSIKIITPWQQKQQQQKEIDKHQQHAHINEINLSGCCFISCDAILTVVSTLSFLTTLHLNRYAPISIPESLHYHPRYYIQTKSIMIDMLRDEVYQQRPRHGLSSANHDLSKQPFTPFILPDTTLRQIIQLTPHLKDLAIQSQQISKETCEAMGQLIPHLCHLDISSCDISVSHLQILLRTIGRQLISLKMLNIDLSNLTILSLLHYGASTLECLHLSCIDPQFLPSLTQLVSHLSVLKDFRLTRLRSENIDYLIHALASRPLIKYIDISPKLELYPKLLPLSASSSSSTSSSPSTSASAATPSTSSYTNISSNHSTKYHQHHNHHHNKVNKKNISPSSSSSLSSARTGFLRPSSTIDKIKTAKGITNNKHHFSSTSNNDGSSSSSSSSTSTSSLSPSILSFTRAECDLYMTPAVLLKLSFLPYLVELRLCFPTINATSLCHFFETTTSPLRILELRLKENKEEQHKKEKHHHHASIETHYYQYKPSFSSIEKDPSLPKTDFLKHINRLTQLHTLYLYGVPINQNNIDTIATMYSLQSMVLDHCGKLGHIDPYFLRKWLVYLPRLKMIRMNYIPYLESTVKDLFHLTTTTATTIETPSSPSSSSPSSLTTEVGTETLQMNTNITKDGGSSNISHNYQHQIKNEMEPFYFGDSMFVRSNGKWEWVD
ncbi:hypothetical protein BJ944DRAFT_269366 [Cunninghamella echinulata]|nr:hypothetical protein BJ944DRAFT_269366 [Cunninghamella echinulata]